jgi:hypothetical protein
MAPKPGKKRQKLQAKLFSTLELAVKVGRNIRQKLDFTNLFA